MSHPLDSAPLPGGDASIPPLTQRVAERVRQAGLDSETPLAAGGATPRRRHSDARRRRAAAERLSEQAREARSLRRVFLDLGDSYREYRRRTGAPLSPEVRDAADRFRRERSLTSLTAVAASLDELRILTW